MTVLEGLKLIEHFDLPHPAWQFVRAGAELTGLARTSAYAGWTVRTVDVTRGKYENLYANWLPHRRVAAVVDGFQRQLKGRGIFVVYPSWRWRRGGTLLKEPGRLVVEAVRGAVVELARHGRVDAEYVYQHSKLVLKRDSGKLVSPADLKHLHRAARVLRGSHYLEWAVSTQGKFLIYRLRDLDTEAKHLVAKYRGARI